MTGTANARITDLGNGITSEKIAEQVHLFYNPADQSSSVAYQYRPSLYVNGAFTGAAGDWQVLQDDIASIATRCFGTGADPVTGADLSKISTAGLALIIKAAFDVRFNEVAVA